ncbi:MAG: MerR family transcriptional regulator [Pseudolysinimonas sp.]
MEWSIQEIAKLAGTTSRTLRHYDETGLVPPSRTGGNGYRYYDSDALVRLQRVLLLRELGLGIPVIGEVLDGQHDDVRALTLHLAWLREEQGRLDRQIASVEGTITTLKGGEKPMAENMFDGFDHTQYEGEVVERWGKDAYTTSDSWWRAKSADEKKAFKEFGAELAFDWLEAATRGIDADSDEAQALARRQYDWLVSIPGTPREGDGLSKQYLGWLGDMYVTDPRFAKNYGGEAGATFVRDALKVFADRNL